MRRAGPCSYRCARRATPSPWGSCARVQEFTELQVGEVLRHHKGPRVLERLRRLRRGDADRGHAGPDGRGDAGGRVFEGESPLGGDAQPVERRSVGGGIWLDGTDLVREHDYVEKAAELQREQYRLDVFLGGVGDEGQREAAALRLLHEVYESGQGFESAGTLAELRLFCVCQFASVL